MTQEAFRALMKSLNSALLSDLRLNEIWEEIHQRGHNAGFAAALDSVRVAIDDIQEDAN